jgi:hypothetical protein
VLLGAGQQTSKGERALSYQTKDSGQRAEFSNGGVRDTESGKPRFDLLLPKNVPYDEQLLTRVALLMGRGAEKYEDRNWEQFADSKALDRAYSSAIRHLMQWANGEDDEDHAAAVVFNIMVAEYVKGVLDGRWKPISPSTPGLNAWQLKHRVAHNPPGPGGHNMDATKIYECPACRAEERAKIEAIAKLKYGDRL